MKNASKTRGSSSSRSGRTVKQPTKSESSLVRAASEAASALQTEFPFMAMPKQLGLFCAVEACRDPLGKSR